MLIIALLQRIRRIVRKEIREKEPKTAEGPSFPVRIFASSPKYGILLDKTVDEPFIMSQNLAAEED